MVWRRFGHLLAAVLLGLAVGLAHADDGGQPDGVVLGTASDAGHAWVLLDAPAGDDGERAWQLVHIPPRAGPGKSGADAGTARFARTIHIRPEFYSASGDRLVMVFPPGEGGQRRVLTLTARPTVAEGVWYFEPGSRLGTLAALPDRPGVTGLRHLDGEPAADLARGTARVLRGGVWSEPERLSGPAIWPTGRLDFTGEASPVGAAGLTLAYRDGAIVAEDESGAPVATIEQETLHRESASGSPASLAAVIPIIAPRPRVLVLTSVSAEGASPAYRAIEVSLDTGRVWYNGPVRGVSPISVQDFRLLVAALVAVLVVTLIVVIRPAGDEGVLALPDGVQLAEPGRRFLATALDLVLITWLVSRLTGGSVAGVISPAAWFTTGPDFGFLYATLLIGLAYGTLFEWLFGRTPGKWLVGCRVVRAGASAATPLGGIGLPGCAMRNAMKWLVPPVALLALLNRSARHRGDVAAGAAVVLDADADEADRDSPGA